MKPPSHCKLTSFSLSLYVFLQIETLEQKKESGEGLDEDQEAKILRKNDVIVQLEQVEKLQKDTE